MKIKFYTVLCLGLLTCLTSQSQDTALDSRGLSLEEYTSAKELKIPNLAKDSYIKKEGLIFDRENPPFQFSFSDGKKRKLFLFQIFETEALQSLGQLAVYQCADGEQERIMIQPIPTHLAPKKVWDVYMDDLKLQNQTEASFSTCLAFALSRQTGPLAQGEDESDEEEYEYCFPAKAQVGLPGGKSKVISQIKPGDWIWAGDPEHPESWQPHQVQKLVSHQKNVALWKVDLLPQDLLASAELGWTLNPKSIQATGNHPIVSERGGIRMDALHEGDVLYIFDQKHRMKIPYQVQKVHPTYEIVKTVYNLVLDAPAYLIEGFMVYQK